MSRESLPVVVLALFLAVIVQAQPDRLTEPIGIRIGWRSPGIYERSLTGKRMKG